MILLAALPVLVYLLYPPGIAEGGQAPGWAARELEALGPVSRCEVLLAALVTLAIVLWIFGAQHLSPTTAALVVVSLMLRILRALEQICLTVQTRAQQRCLQLTMSEAKPA